MLHTVACIRFRAILSLENVMRKHGKIELENVQIRILNFTNKLLNFGVTRSWLIRAGFCRGWQMPWKKTQMKYRHISFFFFNPFRMKTPKYLFPRGNEPSIVSSNWQQKFLYFHYKSVKFDVLGRQNKIWTFGNPFHLKSCQFAPRIVIFNLCYVVNLKDLQIILPKIIPMSHRNI